MVSEVTFSENRGKSLQEIFRDEAPNLAKNSRPALGASRRVAVRNLEGLRDADEGEGGRVKDLSLMKEIDRSDLDLHHVISLLLPTTTQWTLYRYSFVLFPAGRLSAVADRRSESTASAPQPLIRAV